MSYVVPSILVYQQLANAGGVANITPDLRACIIGPCYNVLTYDGTSIAAITLTRATDVSGQPGSITNNQINNVFNLPNQKVGQNLDEASLSVYLNNIVVNTMSTMVTAAAGSNELKYSSLTISGAKAVLGETILTAVTSINKIVAGDFVTISFSGGDDPVKAQVTDVDILTGEVTLNVAMPVSDLSVTITKDPLNNFNTVSGTLRAEAGDAVVIDYINASSEVKSFSSTVSEVIEVDNIVTSLKLADILPSDVVSGLVTLNVRKNYNNLLLPTASYDSSTTGATGQVTIFPEPHLVYGIVVTTDVHIQYRALRTDLAGSIKNIANPNDIEGTLGVITDQNPLALGVQLAMANTIGEISAIGVASLDLQGYLVALDLAQGSRLYALVPLTTSLDVLTSFQQHVDQMSTPEQAHWRIALVNSEIPTTKSVGIYNKDSVNTNNGDNTITEVGGNYILTATNASFLSDGMVPGDVIHITDGVGSPSPVGSHTVTTILNNQQVMIEATAVATGVKYYASRILTKAQQAEFVAGISSAFTDKRVLHTPNIAGVIVNGVTKYLPGYYFMCGVAGLIAGLPSQAGLTNIAMAGFVDCQMSNFYFTRDQMSTMSSAGTFLVVQENQGSIPYIRHELTTDMSVYYYRELMAVKNLDFLSYFFYDILKGFPGRWNITPDSLNTLRQTIKAGGSLLQGKKLPKIGPPLLDFSIKRLEQDPDNIDNVIAEVPVKMPTVMNYVSLYLIV
jgi:hypothetical protein